MGLTLVIKRKFFNIYICSFSTIFYAISIRDTCLRSRKSISKPNFDKISQSTAQMNYFRFRKTWRGAALSWCSCVVQPGAVRNRTDREKIQYVQYQHV